LTLVALAIGAWSITESFDETVPRRIDLTGLVLITVGIGLFTLTFDRAPTWGWLSATRVITLTSLVTLAGVGIAVSGTALEMLQRAGMSPGGAVDALIGVLAALLLPAGVVVLLIARVSRPGA